MTCLFSRSSMERRAFRLLLEQSVGLRIQHDGDLSAIAIWSAMRLHPALVITWLDRADIETRDLVLMIPRLSRQTKLLVVGATLDPDAAQLWAGCRIDGYVDRNADAEVLQAAISALQNGQTYFSDDAMGALRGGARRDSDAGRLSRREAELLPLLARGLTLRDAAAQMTVSYKTADSYRTSLFRKLGLRDRVELARYAIRTGMIDP